MAQVVKASFDTDSQEGQMRVFNAQNGASVSMKELDNDTQIAVSGVLIYRDTINQYGNEQEAEITVLFTEDGHSYASISDTVAKASDKLIDLMEKLGLDSVPVRLIKQKSKQGQEFLNLQIVS